MQFENLTNRDLLDTEPQSANQTWSAIARDAYDQGNISLAATACNPKLDAPITAADRPRILPEPTTLIIPPWRFSEGCRQIPRRPGAA